MPYRHHKNRLLATISAMGIVLLLNGCAVPPRDVKASSESTLPYQGKSCGQLHGEHERLQTKVDNLSEQQQSAAGRDAGLFIAGLILFWPAWFGLAADDYEEELAKAKGEKAALEGEALRGECQFAENFEQPEPQPQTENEVTADSTDGAEDTGAAVDGMVPLESRPPNRLP